MSLKLHQLPKGTFLGIYKLPKKERADFRFGKYIPPKEYDAIGAVFVGESGLIFNERVDSIDSGDRNTLWRKEQDFERQLGLSEIQAAQEAYNKARQSQDLSAIPYFDDVFTRDSFPMLKGGASFDFAPILKRLGANFLAITKQYVAEPVRPVLDPEAGKNTEQHRAALH